MLKTYSTLTKTGIIVFALLSALTGYAVSLNIGDLRTPFDPMEPILLMIGLYLVAAGSFAINQAQEWRIDSKMGRTSKRPIPSGKVAPWQAYTFGGFFCLSGILILSLIGGLTAALAVATVVLYNGVYTLWWKRRMAFGAVPGAIPGAMPVVIGFSVNNHNILDPACVYLFLVLFLWQMPHFWALAIRYREDYKSGGVPVLPVSLGVPRTLYYIGLYTLAYVGVAMAAPWFLKANIFYLFLVVPISAKVLWEFRKYFRANASTGWLSFFLWTNFSLIVYLAVPVVDKWINWMAGVSI